MTLLDDIQHVKCILTSVTFEEALKKLGYGMNRYKWIRDFAKAHGVRTKPQ